VIEDWRVGVDVGGTFTDVVLAGPGGVVVEKLPSTPRNFAEATADGVLAALKRADVQPSQLAELVHGTTVATNAILEQRGARTGLLTTRGFRDVLEIRRLRLPRLYDPLWVKPPPLVERALRLEVDERVEHTGAVLRPLDEPSVRAAVERLLAEQVEAVAVCLLHSYRNPTHERRVGEIVRAMAPDLYLSLSSEVLPQIREYERTSTTVINAYVGPVIGGYLADLEARLAGAATRPARGRRLRGSKRPRLLVMQSGGGVMTARAARRRPVYVVESGPAAGVIAAARLGDAIGVADLITLDMGGTTAKASIVERGRVHHVAESEVGGGITIGNRLNRGGGYLLSVPSIDVCEVGAGGGSIAQVDPGGQLRVGPASAGADPGPACYRRGGGHATLTDVNVVLGLLSGEALVGGALPIDSDAAARAVERDVARPLGLGLVDAAWAAHRVGVASMVRIVRAVSSERGRDPRGFALVAFGGNGPLHGALVAADLAIGRVVVPPNPGLFSAWGLLRADLEYHFGQTALGPLDRLAGADRALDRLYERLTETALAQLAADAGAPGRPLGDLAVERYAELRYLGQSFELRVPVEPGLPPAELAGRFAAEHERSYGHRFADVPVELVNVGIVARAPSPPTPRAVGSAPSLRAAPRSTHRRAFFGPGHGWREVAVLDRADVGAATTRGPLIVEEYDATTAVPPCWTIRRDGGDNLLLEPV
jgi:N-methylhydantoinase A